MQIFTCIGANHIARRRVSASALVAHCGQGFKKCDVLAGLKVGQRQEDHGRSAWNKENKNGNKRLAWQSLCRCLAAVTSSTFFNYFSVSSFFCSLLLTAPTCHRTRPFHQSRNTHCFQPKWLVETGWSLPEHLIPTEKWTKAAMQYCRGTSKCLQSCCGLEKLVLVSWKCHAVAWHHGLYEILATCVSMIWICFQVM